MGRIDKITRVLVQPSKDLILKLHCKTTKVINGVKQDFNNIFEYGDNTYLKMDHLTFLTLEIVNEHEWDKSKNLVITTKNLHQVQQALKMMIHTLKNGDIYKARKKDGQSNQMYDLFIYTEDVKANTMVVKLLGDNSRLGLQPCIYYEEDESTHEGVRIMINKQVNSVDITIEQLEALYYNLIKVDLFMYGQMLVNYYMANIKDKNVQVKTANTQTTQKLTFNTTKEENVSSTLVKEPSVDDVFYMKK